VVKLFIANRGEIACRIAVTAHRMGIATCGVFTPQDARTRHVRVLQQVEKLPSGDLSKNYLNQDLLIRIAKIFGADAVHPGYGFLSESADFAANVIASGLTWVGPSPDAMRKLGGKMEGKEVAHGANVPVLPWARIDSDVDQIIQDFGLPLLIKAAHGGGGRGQRVVRRRSEFEEALRAAKSEAQRSFGSSDVFVEKFLEEPRHIEVQILGDHHGNVFALGERDCTLQRRNQKLIEETPASVIDAPTRHTLHEAARRLARAAGYTNAGTFEFLAQKNRAAGTWEFFFMELNARLQVEHPVTEMVTGLDLVELQIRAARGENLSTLLQDIRFSGHAIELRLCAEDPSNNFLPTPGPLVMMRFPESPDLRVDSGFEPGDVIPQEYDSLFAKMIVCGETRKETIERLSTILDATLVAGTITNKFYLQAVLQHKDYLKNKIHTRWIETHDDLAHAKSDALDQDLIFWGRKLSSDLLVRRSDDPGPASHFSGRILTAFAPDPEIHGSSSPRGVRVAGYFELQNGESIYAAGWVTRFELWIAFLQPVEGVGQRRISFAGQYEIEDLRTHHGPIVAQVPGVVLELRAQSGDIVEALQPILIVEAMKIEMPFTLPIIAKITGILVKQGDRILPGQTLVTWEPVP
jgi:3-methylcrotonyl-CoA carboxylase alpha subunit